MKFTLAVGAVVSLVVVSFLVVPASKMPGHAFFDRTSPWVIAHRGGGGLWPENTLYAFHESKKMGVDVLEMDVRSAKDGVLVVVHDTDLDRTTDGRGDVEELTLAQLKSLDAGFDWSNDDGKTFPFRRRGIRVPSLDEVFRDFPEMRLNVELKSSDPGAADALCQTIRKHSKEKTVMVASFHGEVIEAFRARCPEVVTAATRREIVSFLGLDLFFLGKFYRPKAEVFQVPQEAGGLDVVTPRFVERARAHNMRVQVWTVNQAGEMENLLAQGVDGILTDYPDRLLRLLGRPVPESILPDVVSGH